MNGSSNWEIFCFVGRQLPTVENQTILNCSLNISVSIQTFLKRSINIVYWKSLIWHINAYLGIYIFSSPSLQRKPLIFLLWIWTNWRFATWRRSWATGTRPATAASRRLTSSRRSRASNRSMSETSCDKFWVDSKHVLSPFQTLFETFIYVYIFKPCEQVCFKIIEIFCTRFRI